MTGADTVHNYQQILRQIVYFNRKPAYYLNRAFKLTCSELNGRFSSNDYIQTLTIIHPKVEQQQQSPQQQSQPQSDQAQQSPPPAALHLNDHILTQPVAHAQVHDHKVEMKESKLKTVSGGFLNSALIESDVYGRVPSSK